MDPFEAQQTHKSKRKLWSVLGLSVLLILPVIAGVAYYLLMNNSEQEAATTDSAAVQKQKVMVASKAEIAENISTLNTTLSQASADQATAKAALKDATDQVKVAN